MRTAIHSAAAEGFDRSAAEYERGRPGYPPDAIATLARALRLEAGASVLDLAAGTGKLTRALAATGADVIAVEPVRGMREILAANLPEAEILDGTAEEIPIADASVDAVSVGQAFHWFDGERALPEIHRVLRPGGRLGLVWNSRDETAELQRRITELVEPYRGDVPRQTSLAWKTVFARSALFTELEERQVGWTHTTDVEGLVARVMSISFIAALPDGERRALAERVRRLAPSAPVELAYVTYVYWAERLRR